MMIVEKYGDDEIYTDDPCPLRFLDLKDYLDSIYNEC